MITNRVELIARRRLVRAFILAEAISISFSRRGERTKTSAGGWVNAPATAPLPSQVARLVPAKRRFDNGLVNAEAGEIPHSEYLLLGFPTMDVQVNDEFIWLGDHYQVTGIVSNREERTLCSVDMRGPANV